MMIYQFLNLRFLEKIRPPFEIKFKNEYKKISSIIFDHIYKFDKFIRSTQYYWNKTKKNLLFFLHAILR